jgi:hypothetical protein
MLSPEWVGALGNLVTGLGAGFGGWAALRGVNAWRAETVGRRKTELAEEVLAQFYRARDALVWARLPSDVQSASAEAASRTETTPDAGPSMSAPVERLTQASQVFSDLQASRYRFMAYFGEEAARPFEDLKALHNNVVEAASQLIRSQGKALGAADQADHHQWRATIGWGPQAQDELARRLDRAVREIERTCRPLIEEPKPTPLWPRRLVSAPTPRSTEAEHRRGVARGR